MSHRVVLYSKDDCELCEEARAMLDALAHPYEIAHDPRFSERIPVIEIDGRVITEGRVSERAIRRALGSRARTRGSFREG